MEGWTWKEPAVVRRDGGRGKKKGEKFWVVFYISEINTIELDLFIYLYITDVEVHNRQLFVSAVVHSAVIRARVRTCKKVEFKRGSQIDHQIQVREVTKVRKKKERGGGGE